MSRFMVKCVVMGLALLGQAAPSLAQKSALPEEKKGGDPAPETKTAGDYLRRGRYEDAIRMAKLALGRDERYVPAMVVLAKAYYNLKKFELATSIIDIARSVDPNNGECYNLLGFLSLQRNDQIGATSAFKKATELDANSPSAWNNLAGQYLTAKNYDSALEAASKATALAPKFAKAQINLGSAYRGKNQYSEADHAFKQAIQLDPGQSSAYFNLGILYLDAKEMPGLELVAKLNMAINYLNRYKQAAAPIKDDPVDGYIDEAKKGIEREQKRLERLKRQQERDKAKGAPAPAPAK